MQQTRHKFPGFFLVPCSLCLVSYLCPMPEIEVKIVNNSSNALPEYATSGSSGMDIRADIDVPVILQSLERVMIPTGLFIVLPEGYEAQVRPRSGMAIKQGITCLNTPGTIDADYRGEIKIINPGVAKRRIKFIQAIIVN